MIKVNGITIKHTHFPDGTLSTKIKAESFCNAENPFPIIEWYYENNEEMATLYFVTMHFKETYKEVALNLPYIPNARQDRVKKEEDVFYLKHFANFINSLGFTWVKVRDPHSAVSEALINNLIVESAEKYIIGAIKECDPDMIFYPDEGAMKRYSATTPMEYAFGVKRRDWSSGKIKGLDVMGDVKRFVGKDVLIIDDICSKGGTFYQSATKLKELGVNNIYLYVTHCENTIFEGELLEEEDLIEHIYTTESIFTGESEKIHIIKL
jgi:ribose-phosphate pyrophosphokinase